MFFLDPSGFVYSSLRAWIPIVEKSFYTCISLRYGGFWKWNSLGIDADNILQ